MNNPAVHVSVLIAVLSLFPPSRGLAQSLTLVSTGSPWKYLDDGSDPGSVWRSPAFNDATWLSGPAQLGFGDGDESTVLSRTNALGAANNTYYFRQAFNVADLSAVTNLLVRLRRDDGAIVYLNDVEVFRSNMPQGPVTPATLAIAVASDDGTGLFANSVNRSLLAAGRNVIAVEVHQSSSTSSDISFDLELLANVQFQQPTVSIVTPGSGAVVGSLNLAIEAAAADVDGTIAQVDFYQGGIWLESAMSPPFAMTWSNIAVGSYSLSAVAVDSSGLAATSAPVVVVVPVRFIPSGSLWKVLDSGVDPGPGWITSAYNDATWSEGFARLGFGNGGEATVISRTNLVGGTNITFYFRRSFDVPDRSVASNLVVRVQRDDGCLVYLNGVEIFRNNLPAGPLTSSTLAVSAIDDARFHAARINPALLVNGRNVVAVEVHQAALTSSDISFDLELRPNLPPVPPSITITSPTNASRFLQPAALTVTTETADLDDRIASVGFLLNGVIAATDLTEPFSLSLSNLTTGNYTLTADATDDFGNRTTSAPVQFRVFQPAIVTSLIVTGAVWKYSDTGFDFGVSWRPPEFDDSAWPAGRATLGFGTLGASDIPATPIDIGPAGSRYLTAYFRHHFLAANVLDVTNLAFRVLRDDGCVAYLNGTELFRMNMASGPMSFTNRAVTAVGGSSEITYFDVAVEPPLGVLRDGDNVLAVELHQSDNNSSDAGFDLGLSAVSPVPGTFTRASIRPVAGGLRIDWIGTGYLLQSAAEVGGPYTDVTPTVSTSPYLVPAPSGNRFFRLREGP